MRVITMCLMEALSIIAYIVIIAMFLLSIISVAFAYVGVLGLIFQYTLLVQSIPLNLSWSKDSYSRLLLKIILFICMTIMFFSITYRFYGVLETSSNLIHKDFFTSIYFSVTTWSTLGYGDFKPVPEMRLITSFEALIGILSIPLIFAMIWQYCVFRIRSKSIEEQQEEIEGLKFQNDERGVCQILDEAGNPVVLKQKYPLNPCRKCGNTNISVEKYIDYLGNVTPKILFMVHCTCGNCVYGKRMAMMAAAKWNRKNKLKN